ncbi:hypothetical protein [Massilia sp. UBA6681]|uniref:hypothetical protein n=1 Tax=Massilia sp. UBA6681 TaxID=1946839 RepID=UPI0025C5F2F7|nr:hypothetical protein [Massilia sp. UBA6681]
MPFKGYFIDDSDEARIYATLLSVQGENGIDVEFREVSDAVLLSGELFGLSPDLVALDFALDDNPNVIEPKHAYKGSGLAQLLRDKATVDPAGDFPVVLISAEEKFEKYYRPDSTAHDLFDRTYGKVYTSENYKQVRIELLDLCEGYKILKSVWGEGSDRLSIFGLPEDERSIIDVQELRSAITNAAAPHIAARTILKDVIDRSGILFSDGEVAARLGLSEIGPLAQILTESGLAYAGIFSKGQRRWWAHRFDTWAENLFGQRPANVLGDDRARIIEEKFGLGIAGAVSTWDCSPRERFAFSCASCGRPGEVRHSVSVFESSAPRFVHRRRICWDCVQTERYLDLRLTVDDVDANIVKEVRTKARERYIAS